MKFTRPGFTLFILSFVLPFRSFSQAPQPPFSLEVEEVTWSDWPGLHSFAIGEWDGKWIIAGGRIGGLHAFLPPSPFTVLEANTNIFLFDPETGDQWNANVFSLDPEIADQLRSTNTEYFQRDKYLYVIGGYGKDTIGGSFITFPSLLAIDLEMISEELMNGEDISPAIRQISDSLFQVTGGEIEVLPSDNKIYLFGGHVFTGEYTKPATPAFTQEYTNALKKFTLSDDGINITISDLEEFTDTVLFHRRDLNFAPIIFPGEEFGMAAWSGVFQYEADWVWFNPIFVTSDDYFADTTFNQQLNHYSCPVISIYDSVSENSYTNLFGGIGQKYYDENNDTIKQDLNIPFVNDISTITRYADGSIEQATLPIQFDALLGSNMVFVMNDEIPHYENGVIKLHEIEGEQFAGYLFGGIDALVPNFTPSAASNRLFKVWINYTPVTINSTDPQGITIYPNPAKNNLSIRNKSPETIREVFILNNLGENILSQHTNIPSGYVFNISIEQLPAGIYFVIAKTDEGEFAVKFAVGS